MKNKINKNKIYGAKLININNGWILRIETECSYTRLFIEELDSDMIYTQLKPLLETVRAWNHLDKIIDISENFILVSENDVHNAIYTRSQIGKDLINLLNKVYEL